jgi:hypothetical protein
MTKTFALNEYEYDVYVTFSSFQRIENFIVNESDYGEGNTFLDLSGSPSISSLLEFPCNTTAANDQRIYAYFPLKVVQWIGYW